MKYRVSILPKTGKTYGKNFNTRAECDEFVLQEAEKGNIKKACIYDIETTDKEFIRFDK